MIRLDGGKMKKILFSILLMIAFSFMQEVSLKKNINIDKNNLINKNVNIKGGNSFGFSLNPNMPIEVGITSFNSNESEYSFSVYMINARAVSGVQLDIDSNGVLNVDQVSGGRAEENGFALHHNKNGRILGFSMSGGSIPASASKEKSENILFNVKASSEQELNSSITINPIFADKSAKKMEFKSIPFQIGK
tara:strand:- start:1232 stop:1807 length:576 start_codon:yes stop_codon:yes gene_type:complete